MTFFLPCQTLSDRAAFLPMFTRLCQDMRTIDALPSERERFVGATEIWNWIDARNEFTDELFDCMACSLPWFFGVSGNANTARFTSRLR